MVNFFSGNKSAGRKKKDKTRSKNRHAKTKSRTRRKNHAEREKKSSNSTSNASTPTGTSPSRTPRKDRNSERDRRRMETSRDREKDFKEEKEQESENDDDLSKKKSYSAIHKDAPKKVDIRHRDMDEAEMKKFLANVKEKKPQNLKVLDEKEKILMDRIIKKKYPMKYAKKEKTTIEVQEDPEFFKPSVGKKPSTSIIVPDDTYEHVPKLADVKKMAEEKVFVDMARRDPFWTTVMEPDDEDMKDTDQPIYVGTDHVEQYQDKKLTLKTPKDTKIILDEWAPLATLQKRDDDLFHPHLVFSNTVRSLVNVQAELADHEKAVLIRRTGTSGEEATQAEEESCRAIFSEEKPVYYGYDRTNPILSAREVLAEEVSREAAEHRREPEPTPQNGSDPSDSGSDTNVCGTAGDEKEE